jgi:hypothetical protein
VIAPSEVSPWQPRRLEVALQAPDATRATEVADVDVHATASPGLLVAFW